VQLRNSFPVQMDPQAAFDALLDLERVAPCMPGAELTDAEGNTYHGRLKLRVGPITAAYQGTVTVEEADSGALRAQLLATGEEMGGQGAASARVTATVKGADGGGSQVEVVTDLDIRGKVAQFGRGALGEVTQRVLDQFARNLEASLASRDGEASAVAEGPSAPAPAAPPGGGDLDVLRTLGLPMAKQAAPALLALVLGFLLGRLRRRADHHLAPPWVASAWAPPPWWQQPPHRPAPGRLAEDPGANPHPTSLRMMQGEPKGTR
jgi:carbon monoxide dehydrogenase subunit G